MRERAPNIVSVPAIFDVLNSYLLSKFCKIPLLINVDFNPWGVLITSMLAYLILSLLVLKLYFTTLFYLSTVDGPAASKDQPKTTFP